jgi:hypothetical protein
LARQQTRQWQVARPAQILQRRHRGPAKLHEQPDGGLLDKLVFSQFSRTQRNVTGGLEVSFCLPGARIRLSSPFWTAARVETLLSVKIPGLHRENLYPHLATLVLIANSLV